MNTTDEEDWTVDPETGRCNSSQEYLRLKDEIHQIILNSAHDLILGKAENVAGLILAQLAHRHGLKLPKPATTSPPAIRKPK